MLLLVGGVVGVVGVIGVIGVVGILFWALSEEPPPQAVSTKGTVRKEVANNFLDFNMTYLY